MASVDEVARVAMALPDVAQGERYGRRTWSVGAKTFAWSVRSARPTSAASVLPARRTPILAVRVADLAEKEAMLAEHPEAFFTIPHFDGYAAILIQLQAVTPQALEDAILDGWLSCAPPALAEEHMKRAAPGDR